MAEWTENLIDDDARIDEILENADRVAVLGIRPESHADRPAHEVPAHLNEAGFEILPVPVHPTDATEILGQPLYRSLAEIEGEIDIVDVFRRPEDVPEHLDDILEAQPETVWFQPGTTNEEVAETLAREGIQVVRDRCMKVETKRRS